MDTRNDEPQIFRFMWNHRYRSDVLFECFQAQKFTDMTLSCQNQFIKCHRIVLSSASPYLKEELLKHATSYPIIVLGGISYSALKALIELMYKGKVTVEKDEICEFVMAAKKLKMEEFFDQRGQLNLSTVNIIPVEEKVKCYKQYTKGDLAAAIQDVQNGMTRYAAARAHKVPVMTLQDNLTKAGISPPISKKGPNKSWFARKNRKYTQQDMTAAVQNVLNGTNAADAARRNNIPNNTLYTNLGKLGIVYDKNICKWVKKESTVSAAN